jgi:hypothetical protein
MSKVTDHVSLNTLATRLDGASSTLTVIDMGLIQQNDVDISAVIWTLRDVADKLEAMQAGRYAEPVESEGGHHD